MCQITSRVLPPRVPTQAIQQQGYSEEIGFNAFMYVNVDEMRRVLSWLVGALPAVEEPAGDPKAAAAAKTVAGRGAPSPPVCLNGTARSFWNILTSGFVLRSLWHR